MIGKGNVIISFVVIVETLFASYQEVEEALDEIFSRISVTSDSRTSKPTQGAQAEPTESSEANMAPG
jgi:hypothetical protein